MQTAQTNTGWTFSWIEMVLSVFEDLDFTWTFISSKSASLAKLYFLNFYFKGFSHWVRLSDAMYDAMTLNDKTMPFRASSPISTLPKTSKSHQSSFQRPPSWTYPWFDIVNLCQYNITIDSRGFRTFSNIHNLIFPCSLIRAKAEHQIYSYHMCVWVIPLSYQKAYFLSRIQYFLQNDINLGLCGFIGCLHTYKARQKAFVHDSDTVNSSSMNCNTRRQYNFISLCSVCRSFT